MTKEKLRFGWDNGGNRQTGWGWSYYCMWSNEWQWTTRMVIHVSSSVHVPSLPQSIFPLLHFIVLKLRTSTTKRWKKGRRAKKSVVMKCIIVWTSMTILRQSGEQFGHERTFCSAIKDDSMYLCPSFQWFLSFFLHFSASPLIHAFHPF